MSERKEVHIFGVCVGTATDWTGNGGGSVSFLQFQPALEFDPHLIKCDNFTIDMEGGEITCHNDGNSLEFKVNTAMFLSLLSTATAGMGR